MAIRSLGLLSSFALAASSLLLPPGVALNAVEGENVDSVSQLLALGPIDPYNQLVKIDCPECPVSMEKFSPESMNWAPALEISSLIFNFSISQDHTALLVNGVQTYPTPVGIVPDPLVAPLVRSDADLVEIAAKPHKCGKKLRVNGYELHFDTGSTVADADGAEALLISSSFQAKMVEDQRVHLPKIDLQLLQLADGSLMILSMGIEPTPGIEQEAGCSAEDFWCSLSKSFADRFRSFGKKFRMGCHKHAGMIKHAQGGHHNHNHNHKHADHADSPHSELGGFAHAFIHGFKAFVMPLLIGVAAGLLVYIIGMAAGLSIAFLWLAIRRWRAGGRGAAYVAVDQDAEADYDAADIKDMEKAGFVVEEVIVEAPPAYKDNAEN